MNEKRTFKAPAKKASNQSPDSDYYDTFGIFTGLQEDNAWCARLLEGYAWCAGKNILILSTIFSYMHIIKELTNSHTIDIFYSIHSDESDVHDALISAVGSSSKKVKSKEPPTPIIYRRKSVRESGSSPTIHSLSPSSALGPSGRERCSWSKELPAGKNIAMAGLWQSKDILDHELVDYQEKIPSLSKEESKPSFEEDDKLNSKDLLDTEWIDFQHNIQDSPQAPRRVNTSMSVHQFFFF